MNDLEIILHNTVPVDPVDANALVSQGGHNQAVNASVFYETSGYFERHIDGNRFVEANFFCSGNKLRAVLHETTYGIKAERSNRIKSPRVRKLERHAIASIDSPNVTNMDDFIDMVDEMATKLRENYLKKYNATLDAPVGQLLVSSIIVPSVYMN